jgi:hypothetical protein
MDFVVTNQERTGTLNVDTTKTWIWSIRSNLSDVFSRLRKGIVTSRWYIICYLIPLLHHLAYQSSPGLLQRNPFSSPNINFFKVFHQAFEFVNKNPTGSIQYFVESRVTVIVTLGLVR